VYEFTYDEIRHLSEIRAALEGFAAGRAALVATPEEVDKLEADYSEWRDKVQGDRRNIVAVNDRFHDRVNQLSPKPFLVSMIRDSQRYYYNHQAACLYTDDELWQSMSDHDAIITTLRQHDAAEAERIARGHVEEFIARLKSRNYAG
jgi:DNA-binding GntR family transcriptional regulator